MRYIAIGKCIYCGSTQNLGDEHIVPYSLFGTWILPKASCRNCEKITSNFERKVSRELYGSLRIKNAFPTRRPAERPSHLPMFTPDNETEQYLVRADAALGIVPLIHFAPPGLLRNPPVQGKGWVGAKIGFKGLAADPNMWPKYPLSIQQDLPIDSFARMLAKIAHAYCIAEIGINAFEPFLPRYILGDDLDLPYVVGGLPPEFVRLLKLETDSWQLTWAIYKRESGIGLLVAHLEFLRLVGNSPHCVVVGKATDEFMATYKGNQI